MPAARMVARNAACGSIRMVTRVRGVIGNLRRVQDVRLGVAMTVQDGQRRSRALQRQGEQGNHEYKAFQPGGHGNNCIGIPRIPIPLVADSATLREFRVSRLD